jgi:hypothetical protein
MQGSHPRTGVDARTQYLRESFGAKILTGRPYCGCTGMEPSTRRRLDKNSCKSASYCSANGHILDAAPLRPAAPAPPSLTPPPRRGGGGGHAALPAVAAAPPPSLTPLPRRGGSVGASTVAAAAADMPLFPLRHSSELTGPAARAGARAVAAARAGQGLIKHFAVKYCAHPTRRELGAPRFPPRRHRRVAAGGGARAGAGGKSRVGFKASLASHL